MAIVGGAFKFVFGGGLTTGDGFLIKGIRTRSRYNINVQRFGDIHVESVKPDFWGLRIGSTRFMNRVFAAIKPEWNSLTQYTTGVIPKGTEITWGVIGPQGGFHVGFSFQFTVLSKNVQQQMTRIISR